MRHTVRDLRHRWKPHKERLAALDREQPTFIRFHRACSWMARVEQMADKYVANWKAHAEHSEAYEGRGGETAPRERAPRRKAA